MAVIDDGDGYRSRPTSLDGKGEPFEARQSRADRVSRSGGHRPHTAGRDRQYRPRAAEPFVGDVSKVCCSRPLGPDGDLRELWQTNERQRDAGATMVVEDLLAKGRLRHDRDTSCDVLWLLTSDQPYREQLLPTALS